MKYLKRLHSHPGRGEIGIEWNLRRQVRHWECQSAVLEGSVSALGGKAVGCGFRAYELGLHTATCHSIVQQLRVLQAPAARPENAVLEQQHRIGGSIVRSTAGSVQLVRRTRAIRVLKLAGGQQPANGAPVKALVRMLDEPRIGGQDRPWLER